MAVAVVVLAQLSPPPDAPRSLLPEERVQLQVERARLLESRPHLAPPIATLAIPVVCALVLVFYGAVLVIADCGLTGRCGGSHASAAPLWLGGLAFSAIAAIPGAVWLPIAIRNWASATRAANAIEDRIAPIDDETPDP